MKKQATQVYLLVLETKSLKVGGASSVIFQVSQLSGKCVKKSGGAWI